MAIKTPKCGIGVEGRRLDLVDRLDVLGSRIHQPQRRLGIAEGPQRQAGRGRLDRREEEFRRQREHVARPGGAKYRQIQIRAGGNPPFGERQPEIGIGFLVSQRRGRIEYTADADRRIDDEPDQGGTGVTRFAAEHEVDDPPRLSDVRHKISDMVTKANGGDVDIALGDGLEGISVDLVIDRVEEPICGLDRVVLLLISLIIGRVALGRGIGAPA